MNDIERAIMMLRQRQESGEPELKPAIDALDLELGVPVATASPASTPVGDASHRRKRRVESTISSVIRPSRVIRRNIKPGEIRSVSDHKSRIGREGKQGAGIKKEASPGGVAARLHEATGGKSSPISGNESRREHARATPITVVLPLEELEDQGFITPDLPKGRLSEEFRRVKRPIIRNLGTDVSVSAHPNFVMVTSSVAGEGKTYTAINLAMSLAMERERTVLLVDADVYKGTAGKHLGIPDDCPGLTDLLADSNYDVADIILQTNVPDLRLISAGTRSEQTTELLSSQRMVELVDQLAQRYSDRVIILDCPPMLQTNEANVIAEYAGQIVFVVAGKETDQRLVLEAMSRFEPQQSVGILLNKAANSGANYGYDYGYE